MRQPRSMVGVASANPHSAALNRSLTYPLSPSPLSARTMRWLKGPEDPRPCLKGSAKGAEPAALQHTSVDVTVRRDPRGRLCWEPPSASSPLRQGFHFRRAARQGPPRAHACGASTLAWAGSAGPRREAP